MVQKNVYRKNFSLIIAFLILISVILVIAFIISYDLTVKYVENEFASKKIDVLEQTIKPYNDLFQNKIPEVTSYQGFLDSTSAAKYSASVFHDYSFVKRILFYEILIGGRVDSLPENKSGISIKSVYQYLPRGGNVVGSNKSGTLDQVDFNQMATKLNNFIVTVDTSRVPTQDDIFKTFYDVKPGRISYLNIPRRHELKIYQEIQQKGESLSSYKQNMLTFFLDPHLKIINSHKELYQHIYIKPVVYEPLDVDGRNMITEIAFPGAFSDYKLYFISSKDYLVAEIDRRFIPIGSTVLLVYFFLVLIGWLIYRNLNINLKLFKLQYDFINNFTHEFKTPVSVIKIAGSNLRSEAGLTERQRKHYGKILDEEADKLNELMNKLLSFTQLENKSIPIKKQKINLKEFVKGYIETFKIKYPDFNISLKVTGVDSFYTDPVLLGSIFQNLMENAYKYSDPRHKELHINIRYERRNIVFSFVDKGIGIPKGELNNIFKKFYRLENQYNQNGSVGLGLAFCKELVNFMNGEITVSSNISKGSEFIVTFPYEN